MGSEDTDFDGVADSGDAFPCDWRRTAVTYVPSELELATLMFEDNWPAVGDLDFNDAVVLHHFAVFHDASSHVTGLRVTLVPRALGAKIESGLALRLPVPASAVRSIVRTVGGGTPTNLNVLAAETDLVIPIVTSLRDLWNGSAGFVNTDPALPGVGDAPTVIVELELTQPTPLSLSADPFDLYFFRSADPRHQIHRPQFTGTDTMRDELFGTEDDASSGTRAFVDRSGLPFVLSIPQQSVWPTERGRVETLWPELTEFAASGGTSAADFYVTNVNLDRAYPSPVAVSVPAVDFAACLAPSCSDGSRNGQETDVDCGGGCGACGSGSGCRQHEDCASQVCVTGTCVNVDERSCTVPSGTGIQRRNAEGWSSCEATACQASFHVEAGACAADQRGCLGDNGSGTQTWAGAAWGACELTSCSAGHRLSGGACVLLTYAWSAGSFGACTGGTGSPSYGDWGACSGGTGAWSYDAWGACSASAVCSGSGTQTRGATCNLNASSGAQSRSASCVFNANSGTQTRALTCVNNFGDTVSSGLCTASAPASSQSCTPAGTPASCGSLVTSQACSPTSTALCGASTTSQSCVSPAGSRSCTVPNGSGTQSCSSGATSWSACVATACDGEYVLRNGTCNAPACDDGIRNGTEQNVDCGGSCRACLEAVADTVSVDEGELLTLPASTLLANDFAVAAGGAATVTAVDTPVGGTVQLSGTNVLFRSTGLAGDAASFRYTIQNALGYTASGQVTVDVTLPAIQAIMVDTTADLNTLTGAGTGYVPPSALAIFNTWQRFSHQGAVRPPASTTEVNAWRYVAATDTVESTTNSTTYIGFVSPDALSNYTMEMTLTSAGSAGDNDAIAVVIAFASSGTPGTAGYREYTLSAVRNRPASGDTHTRVGGTSGTVIRWALVYNYNQSDARVLANSTALTSATSAWNGNSTRTRIRIERRGDQIAATASNFGTDTLVAASRMTVDLSSAADLAVFSGPRPWGMGALSQASSTFTNRTFSGGFNASVLHDASVSPARVLDYNATSGAWVVRAGATPQSVLGCPRQVDRPAIATVTPAIAAQSFAMSCSAITRR